MTATTYRHLSLGQRAEMRRSFTITDISTFDRLAGQEGAPADSVPEPLIGALFSYLLGVKLPGFGTNYLKQEMAFEQAAPVGAELTASVEITRLRPDKDLVDLATLCTDATGRVICRGRALVLARDVDA